MVDLAIATAKDIRRTRDLVSWLRRPSIRRVEVALPGLTPSERRIVGRRIRRLFNDCGCLWGAPAFLAALGFLLASSPAGTLSWGHAGASLAIALAIAIVGKLLGLAWSRWRLDRLLRSLETVASDAPASARLDPTPPLEPSP